MPTQRKIDLVEQITQLFSENNYIVATDYRGLTVTQIQDLRKQLRDIGTRYQVVKNNLARFAAQNSGNEAVLDLLIGPTALAFGQDDPSKITKTILDYIRATKAEIKIKGSCIDGRLLDAQQTSRMATLPPIDVLRAQVVGVLQSPIAQLQGVLSATIYNLYGVLNARIQQLGGTADVQ